MTPPVRKGGAEVKPGEAFFRVLDPLEQPSVSLPFNMRFLSSLEDVLQSNSRHVEPSMTTELTVHLVPTPWAEFDKKGIACERFPNVEVTFKSTQPDEMPRFAGVTACLADEHFDLVLPRLSSDIDFTKCTRLLARPILNEKLDSFIKNIEQSFVADGTLRAPAEVDLPVPYSKLAEVHTVEFPNAYKKWDASHSATTPYLFLGMEHKQTVHFEFHGYPLDFTLVEGGRMSGRRSEFVLRPPHSKVDKFFDGDEGLNEPMAKQFYHAAVELALLNTRIANDTLGEVNMAVAKANGNERESQADHDREEKHRESFRASASAS